MATHSSILSWEGQEETGRLSSMRLHHLLSKLWSCSIFTSPFHASSIAYTLITSSIKVPTIHFKELLWQFNEVILVELLGWCPTVLSTGFLMLFLGLCTWCASCIASLPFPAWLISTLRLNQCYFYWEAFPDFYHLQAIDAKLYHSS